MFEIMASETAMVAGVRGEAADILKASESTMVVPPENPEEMARAIMTLIDDPARLKEMGSAGRAFVQEHYLHSKLGRQYLGVFAKLLENKK